MFLTLWPFQEHNEIFTSERDSQFQDGNDNNNDNSDENENGDSEYDKESNEDFKRERNASENEEPSSVGHDSDDSDERPLKRRKVRRKRHSDAEERHTELNEPHHTFPKVEIKTEREEEESKGQSINDVTQIWKFFDPFPV